MESGFQAACGSMGPELLFRKIEARDWTERFILVPHDRYPDTDFAGRVYSWRENGVASFRLVDDGRMPGALGRTRNLGRGPSGLEQDHPGSRRQLPALTTPAAPNVRAAVPDSLRPFALDGSVSGPFRTYPRHLRIPVPRPGPWSATISVHVSAVGMDGHRVPRAPILPQTVIG